MKASFYQYNYRELRELLASEGLSPTGADLLYRWHHREKMAEPCREGLALKTQEYVANSLDFTLPTIDTAHQSSDGTVKFLVRLRDGLKVESVLIPFYRKYSLCVSTQVGCAMQCSFCFTGTQGLKRNLTTEEIVGQFLLAWRWLRENRPGHGRILNLVFMGQGEPLHNFDALKKALSILQERRGTSIAALRITVSTAGYLPGLERWAKELPGVNLALSLHSPFQEKRDQLIPINKRWPLEQVIECLGRIPLKRKQFVIYEYLLAAGFNDGEEDAHATAKLLIKTKGPIVNLIPFNPFPGSHFQRPDVHSVLRFQKILYSYGIPAMIRTTKGDDILAACGQLNTKLEAQL